ncbi:hypothetical protein QO058_18835 [Bosea vestrisii]|uniref:hypothetical protein n=1 Tax=Bosea vestrisii TaxID=151416 RepID=UPI0024E0234B|nr:hypothetical protein [Bosea vestrisii]WID94864.1 hypothetical protein QO058_18835 [Bosea vestrisii]
MRLALNLKKGKLRCDARGLHAFGDRRDQRIDLALDLLKPARSRRLLRTTFRAHPIELCVKLPNELIDHLRRHQLLLKSVQNI